MRRKPAFSHLLPIFALGAIALAAAAVPSFSAYQSFPHTAAAPEDSPVVLELFTSAGCSSCPPADELISRIGATATGVIALAYHVDYWDGASWSDPFSSGQWTARQSVYERALRLNGAFTPQMVINGRWQCVGSDARAVAGAIAAARATPPAGAVTVRIIKPAAGAKTLTVEVGARMVHRVGDAPLIVLLAVYENGLVADIDGGENRGHRLTYDYTVRKVVPAFQLNGVPGPALENAVEVELDSSWKLAHVGVAAFIQDEDTLAIYGAAARYPIAPN
ncbi:MAG TPA: DUF1223 domain-containing protein [Candidatus Binataceae bacterium]|nr:DUF1223 domain-containing protein [Candidatus Binataceae bacterium]